MNIGFYACLTMAIIFAIFTIIFAILGKKAAILIAGFNSLSKQQRAQYNTKKLSKDQTLSMLIWTIIMIIGAVLSHFISQYMAIAAFIIWLFAAFKDFHWDAEKAFEKYKL